MTIPESKTLPDALRALLGAPIASVAFVEDYVQIEVAGSRMTILEPPMLQGGGRSLHFGDPSFSGELNACTGASIDGIQADEERVDIQLSNGKSIRINLSEPTGTKETFIYQDGSGRLWVAGPH